MSNLLSSNRGALSLGIVALFFFYDYFLKFSITVFKPALIQEFHISATEFGLIMSMYMLPYGIMQIPAGIMVDRWGPRKIITFSALICGIGCLLFSVANSLTLLLIGRALIGFGSSFAIVTYSKLAVTWFNPNRFAFLFSSLLTLIFVGAVFGMNISVFSINIYDLHKLGGALYLLIALMMWWIIRDINVASTHNALQEKTSITKVYYQLTEIIMSKQAWLSAIYAGLMFVPTTMLGFWGITYLIETNNLSLELAGGLTSAILIGFIVGSPTYGFISDLLGKRKLPMFFSTFATLLFSSILIFSTGLSYIQIAILMFLIGFCSSGFALAFTVLKENYSIALVGVAIGFMNTVNTVFESSSTIVVGKILDLQLYNTMLENYQCAFMFIPASMLLALGILIFIKAR
jgi:MFS family permease